MNERALVLTVAVVLLAGCGSTPRTASGPAAPDDAYRFETGPGPYSFDFDVETGRYRERNLHVPSDRITVTGIIQIVTSKADANWGGWGALAAVELAGATEHDIVGFVAFVTFPDMDKIQLGVRNGFGGTQEPRVFASLPLSEKGIPFEVKKVDADHVTVSVLGIGRTVSVHRFEMTRVRVVGSSGHVRFSDVAVNAAQ